MKNMRDIMNLLNEGLDGKNSSSIVENMNNGPESWLKSRERENAEKLVAQWPEVKPGMFVQDSGWGGDVWAEITSVYLGWDDASMRSVNFIDYEKYGVSRKPSSARFGSIRKFATRDEIDFDHSTVMTPTAKYEHGHVVEWPAEGPFKRDLGGYEQHPTISKEQSRAKRDELFYGKKNSLVESPSAKTPTYKMSGYHVAGHKIGPVDGVVFTRKIKGVERKFRLIREVSRVEFEPVHTYPKEITFEIEFLD